MTHCPLAKTKNYGMFYFFSYERLQFMIGPTFLLYNLLKTVNYFSHRFEASDHILKRKQHKKSSFAYLDGVNTRGMQFLTKLTKSVLYGYFREEKMIEWINGFVLSNKT